MRAHAELKVSAPLCPKPAGAKTLTAQRSKAPARRGSATGQLGLDTYATLLQWRSGLPLKPYTWLARPPFPSATTK